MAEHRHPNPGGKPQPAAPKGPSVNSEGLPRSENMTPLATQPVGSGPGQPETADAPGVPQIEFASNASKRLPATAQAFKPERHLDGIAKAGGRVERRGGQ